MVDVSTHFKSKYVGSLTDEIDRRFPVGWVVCNGSPFWNQKVSVWQKSPRRRSFSMMQRNLKTYWHTSHVNRCRGRLVRVCNAEASPSFQWLTCFIFLSVLHEWSGVFTDMEKLIQLRISTLPLMWKAFKGESRPFRKMNFRHYSCWGLQA